jgi:hypothetical protein
LTEIRSCALIVLLTLLLQACTTARTQQRHFNQAFTQLEHSTDADSLAAAAMLSQFTAPQPREETRHALLARAVAAAPQRADLAWLSIQACRDIPACDLEPEVDRLRALDPSNGAGWLNAVARANAADDEAAKIAALSALARAERVDVCWTTLIEPRLGRSHRGSRRASNSGLHAHSQSLQGRTTQQRRSAPGLSTSRPGLRAGRYFHYGDYWAGDRAPRMAR